MAILLTREDIREEFQHFLAETFTKELRELGGQIRRCIREELARFFLLGEDGPQMSTWSASQSQQRPTELRFAAAVGQESEECYRERRKSVTLEMVDSKVSPMNTHDRAERTVAKLGLKRRGTADLSECADEVSQQVPSGFALQRSVETKATSALGAPNGWLQDPGTSSCRTSFSQSDELSFELPHGTNGCVKPPNGVSSEKSQAWAPQEMPPLMDAGYEGAWLNVPSIEESEDECASRVIGGLEGKSHELNTCKTPAVELSIAKQVTILSRATTQQSGSSNGRLGSVMRWMPSTLGKVSNEVSKFMTAAQVGGANMNRKTMAVERQVYQSYTWEDQGCKGLVQLAVSSDYFDHVMGFFLLLNAFTIGYQTNHMATKDSSSDVPTPFRIIDICFCVIFTLELSLRLFAEGCSMYWKKNWQWSVFDTVIVGFQIIDELTLLIFSGTKFQQSIDDLTVLRMLRLTRIVRLVRMVRLIPELKSMVYLIFASMNAFFWTGVLLSLLMYCVAVFYTENAGRAVRDISDEAKADAIRAKWGSISLSVLSLFQAITGGDDWNVFLEVFADTTSYMTNTIVFSIYIAFATLVMLNLVTGVFVEGAQRIIKEDKDMELVKHVYKLFSNTDQDNNASITWDEFQEHLEDTGMDEYFKAVDLSQNDAEQLFRLLDRDGSGSISIEEFVRGCLRLRGPARSIDLAALVYDFNIRFVNSDGKFKRVEENLKTLTKATIKTLALVSRLGPSSHQPVEGILV